MTEDTSTKLAVLDFVTFVFRVSVMKLSKSASSDRPRS